MRRLSDFGNRQSGMGLGVDWLGGDSGAGGNRGGAESGREDGEIYGIGAASAGIVAAFSAGDAEGRRPARPLVWRYLCGEHDRLGVGERFVRGSQHFRS